MSKGGFKAFRGAAADAEKYLLNAGAADVLEEYLSHDSDLAVQHGILTDSGTVMGELSRDEFRRWMEHYDPQTGEQRGAFRTRTYIDKQGLQAVGGTPLYQETLISSSKSLSLAAAADPRIEWALVAAQARAAIAAGEALQEHAVTRVGPKGAQYQVKFERFEFTSVQHKTSRAGDPHYHRHMQVQPKGFAEGKWRSIDGASLYRLAERVHAAADLSMGSDVELRQSIADAGYTWQPGIGGGEIVEFEPLVDEFSSRRNQIAENRAAMELQWRAEHLGQEPGPGLLRSWDQHGWAHKRPSKKNVDDLTAESQAERISTPVAQNVNQLVTGQIASQISPDVIAHTALSDLSQQKSAWSNADLSAAIDRRLAVTYLLGNDGVAELRRASLEAAQTELHSFFDDGVNVEGARHWTSKAVLATEAELTERLTTRAQEHGHDGNVKTVRGGVTLSDEQVTAAKMITGSHRLVVIEGAAGAGKTTMLDAANNQLKQDGRRMVVVSPTKRGALEAGAAIGAEGNSVHSMLYRAGAFMDEANGGRWVLPRDWQTQPPEFTMNQNTVLVVDEAGMLDQETAAVLHKYIDDQAVGTLVLTGDTKQLAPVGRGGYMARAAELSSEYHDLREVHRFRTAEGKIDTVYAEASVELRERKHIEEFYELLAERGQVKLGTPQEVVDRVSETVALELMANQDSLAIVSTNATAQQVNHAVFERLAANGMIDDRRVVLGRDDDPIAVGARVATRQNDRDLDVANRQTWKVTHVNKDGRIVVQGEDGRFRSLDKQYVTENVQLAYSVTAHGSQGMTVDTAHIILTDEMDAAGAYVGLTRGRNANVLHVVAVDHQEALDQFTSAMTRNSSDQGLGAAREQAERDVVGLDPNSTQRPPKQMILVGAGPAAPWRSGLHGTLVQIPEMQKIVEGLAELEDDYKDRQFAPDAEFEQRVKELRVGPMTLEATKDDMNPDMRRQLLTRREIGANANASQTNERALRLKQQALQKRDPFGVKHGRELRALKQDIRFEGEYRSRVMDDLTNGNYQSREHERGEHQAQVAQRGSEAEPTAMQRRLEKARAMLQQDQAASVDHDRSREQSQGMEID